MLAWIIAGIMAVTYLSGIQALSMPARHIIEHHTPDTVSETAEWDAFHAEAYAEYADVFTALYEGYETRWSKNGRLMLRNGGSGPYKFVAKGK
jgi:hypothetical protein